MQQIKRFGIGFFLLILLLIEFILGFVCAIEQHVSQAVTALNLLYKDAATTKAPKS